MSAEGGPRRGNILSDVAQDGFQPGGVERVLAVGIAGLGQRVSGLDRRRRTARQRRHGGPDGRLPVAGQARQQFFGQRAGDG